MGSNFTDQEWEIRKSKLRIGEAVQVLKSHPNFESKKPIKGESAIQFTLRSIAHLISPPMEDGEDNEIACTDLRDAVLGMKKELENIWNKYNK